MSPMVLSISFVNRAQPIPKTRRESVFSGKSVSVFAGAHVVGHERRGLVLGADGIREIFSLGLFAHAFWNGGITFIINPFPARSYRSRSGRGMGRSRRARKCSHFSYD